MPRAKTLKDTFSRVFANRDVVVHFNPNTALIEFCQPLQMEGAHKQQATSGLPDVFTRAELASHNARGRPRADADHKSKIRITTLLDEDVLEWLQADGRSGYQTRLNAYLRAIMEAEQA